MTTPLQELTVLCALLDDVKHTIAAPYHGWRVEKIADLLDMPVETVIDAIRAAAGITDATPSSIRIDKVMQALQDASATPPGGWSTQSLADFAGVQKSAIQTRLQSAIHHLRAAMALRD